MYNQHIEFVRECLEKNEGLIPPDSNMMFRSKYQHILRVLNWSKKLIEERDDVDKDILFMAAIFHDVGYSKLGKAPHAELGANIFEEYAKGLRMNEVFISAVSEIIRSHSSKELLYSSDVPIELKILIEADILDEEGALRMIWYTLDKGVKGVKSYEDIYEHIVIGNNKRLVNPMVTEKGNYYWNLKKKLVDEFTEQLKDDIELGYLQAL